MLQKISQPDTAETLKKAWTCLRGAASAKVGRYFLKANYHGPLPLLDFIVGQVVDEPSSSNKTRVPRLWKCSRRVRLIQQGG